MKKLLLWFTTRFFWIAITLIYKSARILILGEEKIEAQWTSGRKVIVTFFHGDYLLLFPHFRGREACIFTTRSRRGEYLAEIIRLFRYHPCLIPEGSGGHIALDLMVREIQSGHNAVIVADGPKGPYHQVKHGALVLAARTGNPILPVGIASACRIVLRHRWDRYTIPLPLTRAVIAIGDPIFVPKRIGNSGLESLRRRLEDELVRLNRQARASLSGRHSPDRAV